VNFGDLVVDLLFLGFKASNGGFKYVGSYETRSGQYFPSSISFSCGICLSNPVPKASSTLD